jgi:hypothetical protein
VGPRGLELRAKHAVCSNESLIHPIHEVAALWREGEPFRWRFQTAQATVSPAPMDIFLWRRNLRGVA